MSGILAGNFQSYCYCFIFFLDTAGKDWHSMPVNKLSSACVSNCFKWSNYGYTIFQFLGWRLGGGGGGGRGGKPSFIWEAILYFYMTLVSIWKLNNFLCHNNQNA